MKLNISDMMDTIRDDTVPIRVDTDASTGTIKETVLSRIHAAQPSRPRRSLAGRVLRTAVAACLTILLLAVPVSAELRTGYVSNLLAPLYGMAQTELVDDIGVPLGASVDMGEYTLSADAVIGDRYHIAIVYSLTRNDGQPIDPWLRFDDIFNVKNPIRGSGGGWGGYYPSEDGKKLHIVQAWSSSNRLRLRRKTDETFTDLQIWDPVTRESTTILEGEWHLRFLVRYKDTTLKLPVRNLPVEDPEGNHYTIHKIQLSPIGIHMDMTVPNFHPDGVDTGPYMTEFAVSVLLKDGRTIQLDDHGAGHSGPVDKPTHRGNWRAMFDTPIPLEDIKALNICGTVVPVDAQ